MANGKGQRAKGILANPTANDESSFETFFSVGHYDFML